MVDAIVSTVIDKLTTVIWDEIKQEVQLVMGVEEDVEKLKSTFIEIQDVLDDAEKKQFMKRSVKLWLQKLKDVAYDIEDVLDEWNTAILKSQLEQRRSRVDDDARRTNSSSTSKKVCLGNLFCLPSCCFSAKQVGLRHDTGRRIKKINENMVDIAKSQEQFHFIRKTTTRSSNAEIRDKESKSILETSSSVDVSEVFGRDDDKARIISKLLGEGISSQQQLVVPASTIPVISIVGMGGLGKTTLAQLVFNDERVEKHFEKRVWIHVGSQSFDKKKIAINIIREIGGSGDSINQLDGDYNNNTWQSVHDQLNKSVNAKHFLLVLDDVWNENSREWDPLRISLKRGSQGSTIIITTRKLEVANMMGATYVHNLDILSEEACWSLLRSYAFVGRQEEEYKKLEETGRKLAEKCKGLPLSVRTLGGVLRSKKWEDWQSVLDNDLWNVISTSDQILPSLLISYNELDPHLKQCFAYCSHIPRGYKLYKEDMIFKWMGQGFLSDHIGDLFTRGEEFFNHLVMRSFFQKNVTKSSGLSKYYTMHDLVCDFAKSLEEDACSSLEIRDTTRTEELSSRARHLSLVLEETSAIPPFIYKAKNLRSLRIYGCIPRISSELFGHFTCLRTLDLSFTYLDELLPNEIEKLIHLRYLDLSEARFEELPKSVTTLYNLQVLILFKCKNLCRLPEGIGALINLVNLNLGECQQLSYLPEGIGRLTKLRDLSDFIISGVERVGGSKIEELKDLNFLHVLL